MQSLKYASRYQQSFSISKVSLQLSILRLNSSLSLYLTAITWSHDSWSWELGDSLRNQGVEKSSPWNSKTLAHIETSAHSTLNISSNNHSQSDINLENWSHQSNASLFWLQTIIPSLRIEWIHMRQCTPMTYCLLYVIRIMCDYSIRPDGIVLIVVQWVNCMKNRDEPNCIKMIG